MAKGRKRTAVCCVLLALLVFSGCEKDGGQDGSKGKKRKQAETSEKSPSRQGPPSGMVRVPAGKFKMGMKASRGLTECKRYRNGCKEEWFAGQEPVHEVYLAEYYMDKHEVTEQEYDRCVKAGACDENEKKEGFSAPSQPVVNVSWHDARDYCEWAGKRLPTEAEWEKAARGDDERIYPWGDNFAAGNANFCDRKCPFDWAWPAADDGHRFTAPAGRYPKGASPYGALDMAGNVFEWVADRYDKNYYRYSPQRDPKGPDKGNHRVLRGGSWYFSAGLMQSAFRLHDSPESKDLNYGFRCAWPPRDL